MSKRIPPRDITADETSELLKLTRSDITSDKLKELFAVFMGQDRAKFQPNDRMTLPAGKLYNKTSIKTTVGRYIVNMFCIPVPYLKKFGYINEPQPEGFLSKKFEPNCATMILNDEMTTKEYAEWMDNTEWMCMNMAYYINPSHDKNSTLPFDEVMDKKAKLFDKYKTELAHDSVDAAAAIEKELMSDVNAKVKELDDPSFDWYTAGIWDIGVNYKKNQVMAGSMIDPSDGKVHILKSNYINGISKDEYDRFAALTVIGGYSRGVATRDYGYESKKYNSALQNTTTDITGKNIDCGTKLYLTVKIEKDIKNMFLYRFIIDGSSLVELTPENIDRYVGKEVKMRSPMFCKSDQICEHCAGTLYKRMNISTIGAIASNLTGNLLNLSMKKMHDSTVKFDKINLDEYIIER